MKKIFHNPKVLFVNLDTNDLIATSDPGIQTMSLGEEDNGVAEARVRNSIWDD